MRIDTFQAAYADYKWLESCGNGWQFGEQGIIDAIVERLGLKSGTCVEIGAGDGGKLPLTCERLYHAGWRTICYEIDAYKRAQLSFKFPLATVNDAWDLHSELPQSLDLVVIDVDSNENTILTQIGRSRKHKSYDMPAIVICEHFDKAFTNEEPRMRDVPVSLCGLPLMCGAAIQENSNGLAVTAKILGYERIGWTRVNTFFVRTELCTRLT